MGSAAGDSGEDNRFDGLFATVAEQAGGIEPLFDYFFGFLCRKTDFFTVGRAACKDMLDTSFRKWTEKATEKAERDRLQREKQQQKQQQQQQQQQKQQKRQQQVDLSSRPKVEELTEEEEALFAPAEKAAIAAADATASSKSTGEEGSTSDEERESSRPEGNGGQTDK